VTAQAAAARLAGGCGRGRPPAARRRRPPAAGMVVCA
jgi:hypothetical protein